MYPETPQQRPRERSPAPGLHHRHVSSPRDSTCLSATAMKPSEEQQQHDHPTLSGRAHTRPSGTPAPRREPGAGAGEAGRSDRPARARRAGLTLRPQLGRTSSHTGAEGGSPSSHAGPPHACARAPPTRRLPAARLPPRGWGVGVGDGGVRAQGAGPRETGETVPPRVARRVGPPSVLTWHGTSGPAGAGAAGAGVPAQRSPSPRAPRPPAGADPRRGQPRTRVVRGRFFLLLFK